MKSKKRNVKAIIVIIGVIIIPLLYSYFYLGAFWDPYSSLETLPVAVVNNDQGAVINDEDRNLGEELCKKLTDDGSLKFIVTDEKDAKSGTEGDDYYAMIVIPEEFSKDIASVNTTDKQTATISFSPNQKRNYLASQILGKAVLQIEESTRATVNKEIVQSLADNLNSVPNKMAELQDGMDKIYDGSTELKDGAATLADGTATFDTKLGEYSNGVTDAKNGSSDLAEGAKSLNSGIDQLLEGANKLEKATTDIGQLTAGSKTLADGAKQFNTSLIQYTAGVDSLIETVNTTSTFLTTYVTKVNPAIMKDKVFAGFITKMADPANAKSIQTLQGATKQLKDASKQIADGAEKLSQGSTSLPELKKAIKKLSDGLASAKEGSKALATGSEKLYEGLGTINDATAKLSEAAGDISEGATTLSEGTVTLNDGIKTAKDGVDESITSTDEDLAVLDGIAEYAEEPVNIEETDINPVPNYGTAFAPYFLSLSLWVGALLVFFGIYLDADGKFKILSRNSERIGLRTAAYLGIGVTQAIVLAAVVQFGLGLEVSNVPLYYASCSLVSLVSIAIVQFLLIHFKDVGKFLAIALLILQLTSCGGTFPMETVPEIFNVMYPFMPMTYGVALFKQAISGVDSDLVAYNGGVLVAILVAFVVLTLALSAIKAKHADRSQELIEETN